MKIKVIPIAGDASFRTFYRLLLNKTSKIVVFAKKEKYKNLIAYAAVNKFLRNNKILAPKLYAHNYPKSIIVIEDFGDLSFNKILSRKINKLSTYKQLVNFLLKIQKIKIKIKIKSIKNRPHIIEKYSKTHLFRESNLFFDWYLPLFLSKKKTLDIKKKSNKILLKLYSRLNLPNSHFVHRDYHAHNLIKVGNKVGIIDSQDALIGNPAYDLVSLVDDVRIKTSTKLKNKICSYYLSKTLKIYKIRSKDFLEDFNILSVQRSLKIIGIFSRLFIRDKKKKYLKFIPYAWRLLEMRMKSEIFCELKKIFDKDIPKKFKKKIILK